ncbi:MAG: AAA family ATPase [Nitrospiraceae bacterium]|nr:MAG: AAA family ATPase [Nitrospiraceae bacterium]
MYKEYFGLEEMPFSIAPDPRYLYMSGQHREALAHLLYGFNSDGGFVLLTGEIGTGKTTVCRCLLEQAPENIAIAFIINPRLTVEELLATICDEFGIQYPEGSGSIKLFIDLINSYLLELHATDKKAVLIIDEAQNLSAEVLEQLRLLTNLETSQVKLLQIILLGQPELREKLSRPGMKQLTQRIIARYHLGPLSKRDVAAYVAHRLTFAGAKRQLFSDSAINKLYRLTGGVPRLINLHCDRALLGAFAQEKNRVTKVILKKASREISGESGSPVQFRKIYAWSLSLSGFIIVIAGVVFGTAYYNTKRSTEINKVSAAPVSQLKESPAPSGPLLRPASLTSGQSKITAFQSLFSEWNLTYNPVEYNNACDYAQTRGLQCYYQRGNLRSLVILDHPAVLRLIDVQGQEFYATLKDIKGDFATVVTGDKPQVVPLRAIESQWLGDYILLWQVPQKYQGEIKPGAKDALVPWIDNKLALIQNTPYRNRSNILYDEELADRVKEFQASSGFFPDGIIGPQTLMRLNSSGESSAPRLTKEAPDKKD